MLALHHHPSFSLLGPLVVRGLRGEIPLGGNRQRILLTVLLLEANRAVGLERLIDAIWGGHPPASARSQVRVCVSGLRRELAASGVGAQIETHAAGYLCRVPRERVDLHRFGDLMQQARTSTRTTSDSWRVERFRDALRLWRGPIGAGLESAVLDSAALKFDEDRSAALEDCFELELQLGFHRQILGELTQCVAEHPFRETLCAQLMVALFHSGRTAEALSLYHDTRKRFVSELGIEPGERLRAVERLILTGEPDAAGQGRPSGGMEQYEATAAQRPMRFGAPGTGADVGELTTDDRIALLEQQLLVLREQYARSSGRCA